MPVSKNRRKKPKAQQKKPKAPKTEPVAAAPEPVAVAAAEPVAAQAQVAVVEPTVTHAAAVAVVPPTPAEPLPVVEPVADKPAHPRLTVVTDEGSSDVADAAAELHEMAAEPPSPFSDVADAAAELHEMAAEPPSPFSDPFGRDPEFERRALKALEVLYRRYFRVEAREVSRVPEQGPAILVANHSGALPWDGAMLKCALAFDHPAHRSLRPLSENVIFHFPFLGVLFNRFGAVRACQENAEALLAAGEPVAVFPEGVKGLGKLFGKRYQLQRFGRGGFVKLAMRTRAPIIPVAIVGAEEAHPLLARVVRPVEPLGLPYMPVTPTFPLLGPLGLIPLPTKWTIEFGEPIHVDPSQVSDELAIERLTEDVRADIQTRIDRLLSQRTSWFR